MEPMEIVRAGQEKDSGVVEVMSDILMATEEAQIEASAELLATLRYMVNEPAFSDVTFICNDGEQVKGSRILASRSDMLKSMFMNGMAESSQSVIQLPLISSPVLLSVLEFLYTGTLSTHLPQNWRMGCEVVSASRFFLLPNLEKITRKLMHAQIVSVAGDLPKAASLLTEAVGFQAMCEESDISLRNLVTILSSDWSDKNFVLNLSKDALNYLLANSKGKADSKRSSDCKPVPFTEYLRFRQVMRWWVNQSDFDVTAAKEELVSLAAPENALSICEDPNGFPGSFGDSGCLDPRHSDTWSSLQLNTSTRDSALTLLSNINFKEIHPVLLEKVVEPLKVVSSAEMWKAFRWHALRRHFLFKKNECGWDLSESFTTLEQGYVVKKTRSKTGLAVARAAVGRSICLYQWSFIVDRLSDRTSCELGFMYYETGVEVDLNRQILSDLHGARVLRLHGELAAVNWHGAGGGRLNWETILEAAFTGARILFTFDPLERTCSLAIGNIYFGKVWKNLPEEVYFPAVSLDRFSESCVRIELGSGLTYCESTDAQELHSKPDSWDFNGEQPNVYIY